MRHQELQGLAAELGICLVHNPEAATDKHKELNKSKLKEAIRNAWKIEADKDRLDPNAVPAEDTNFPMQILMITYPVESSTVSINIFG